MYPTLVVVLVASRNSVLEPSVALSISLGDIRSEANPEERQESTSGVRHAAHEADERHAKGFNELRIDIAREMRPASENPSPSSDEEGGRGKERPFYTA